MTVQSYFATLSRDNTRGLLHAPEPASLKYLTKLASKPRNHVSVYTVTGSEPCRLKLDEACLIANEMNAYDDTHVFVVPYEGTPNAESHNRLRQFCWSLCTANGLAGYGSTWDAVLVPEHQVAVLRQRCSIPD